MKTMMKAVTVSMFLLVALLMAVPVVFGDEVSAIWSRLYGRAHGYKDRIMIMNGLVEIDDPAIVPFLGSSLEELNDLRQNDMSVTERTDFRELTKLVVRRLGEFRAAEYSDLIFDVFNNEDDTYLRAEAALALGRTVNPEYADDISIFLRNLNLNIGAQADDKDSEVLALASILALERLKQPVGFNPLFFASIGWYSRLSDVREQATRVLDSLVDDPTEILEDLVRLETVYSVKLEALEAEARSRAPASGKAEVATEALRQGLINVPKKAPDQRMLGRIRQRSMEILIEYETNSPAAIPYLEEIITGVFDINEQLTAITVLQTDGSDEAVLALIRFLKRQNDRRMAGLNPADYRIVRATIQSLGVIGNRIAYEELAAAKISDWPAVIVKDADAALKALE